MDAKYFVGVDVGSKAVKVVALDSNGKSVGFSSAELNIRNPQAEYYEQSSDQIWKATCQAIKAILPENLLKPENIGGIGFTGTCSLVILDESGSPINLNQDIDKGDETSWNVIMWMDHRAKHQAHYINSIGHPALTAVGGKISPEMQPPKLLWLKQNLPDIYRRAGHYIDLADFLTYKATGSLVRSLCSVTCKWLYGRENKWDSAFYESADLDELTEHNFWKIGPKIASPGASIIGGLSAEAAEETGLLPNTPVAVSMIDAHAGCLGVLSSKTKDATLDSLPLTQKLGMICGTSACHMAFSSEPKYVEGVWGPYHRVVFDGFWLNEAGQSALASILDLLAKKSLALIYGKDNYSEECKIASSPTSLHAALSRMLREYSNKHGYHKMIQLCKNIHVWPDYHGNRSPLANHNMAGAILGLKLESDVNRLEYGLGLYLAHIQAFGLMTRYIIETLQTQGDYKFAAIYMCGGLQKNEFYVQAHADACDLPVVVAAHGCPSTEMAARGAAVLGAQAAQLCPTLQATAERLALRGIVVRPKSENREFYCKKYEFFRRLGDLMIEVTRTT